MVWFNLKKATIQEGDHFPATTLYDEVGHTYYTGNLKQKWHVFYFYPKNNTPGCTTQAQTFSALQDDFEKENTTILGINTQSPESHSGFRNNKSLNFRILSDPDGKLAALLGVKIFFGMCSRDSVIVNPEGKIDKIMRRVHPRNNPREVLEHIQTARKSP